MNQAEDFPPARGFSHPVHLGAPDTSSEPVVNPGELERRHACVYHERILEELSLQHSGHRVPVSQKSPAEELTELSP